jgi:hypothetical protein
MKKSILIIVLLACYTLVFGQKKETITAGPVDTTTFTLTKGQAIKLLTVFQIINKTDLPHSEKISAAEYTFSQETVSALVAQIVAKYINVDGTIKK